MAKQINKKVSNETFESVKIKTETVNKVRDNKEITGIPVGVFFAQAAEEKLKKKK